MTCYYAVFQQLGDHKPFMIALFMSKEDAINMTNESNEVGNDFFKFTYKEISCDPEWMEIETKAM